jgi:hypothetical protein
MLVKMTWYQIIFLMGKKSGVSLSIRLGDLIGVNKSVNLNNYGCVEEAWLRCFVIRPKELISNSILAVSLSFILAIAANSRHLLTDEIT